MATEKHKQHAGIEQFMSTTKTLTISVAAFNMEKYLRRALDSLCSPDVLERLEVFVVDDGSTDATYSIAQEYATTYPSTFHAIHKENEGYGSTINWSLEHATGKYFKVLDADDWFDTEGLRALLDLLDDCMADIVVSPYWEDKQKDQMVLRNLRSEKEKLIHLNGRAIDPPLNTHELTIRTSVLTQSLPKLPHNRHYTDSYLRIIPLSVAKAVQFAPTPVYCYWHGRPGQSMSSGVQAKHFDDMLLICDDLVQFCNEQRNNKNYQTLLHQTSYVYINTISTLLKHLPTCRKTLGVITNLEHQTALSSKDVFEDALHHPTKLKTTSFLRLMRKTGYRSYWLLTCFLQITT